LPQARQWIDSPTPFAYTPYREAGNAVLEVLRVSQIDVRSEWWDESEAFVADCMKRAGFEYHPTVYTPASAETEDTARYGRSGDVLGIPWLPPTRADVERVGYGIMSVSDSQGLEQFESEGPADPAAAKNEDYWSSLSQAARGAYDFALHGVDPVTGEGKNPSSCRDQAYAQHPEPAGPSVDFLAPLDAALAPYSLMVALDGDTWKGTYPEGSPWTGPESIALGREFAACVGESPVVARYGLPLADESSPLSLFGQAVSISPQGELFDPQGGGELWSGGVPDDQASLVGSPPEREIALLDFDCRERTDYVARYAGIDADFQAAYVAEHKAELDAMMAAAEAFLARHS
jgi:hypothetical protein